MSRNILGKLTRARIPGSSPLGHAGYLSAALVVAAMGWILYQVADDAGAVALAVLAIAMMLPGYVGFLREARGRQRAERLVSELANSVPGVLVKYRVFADGRSQYEYLSEGVERLRGIDRAAALRDPEVVLGTILPGDREAFVEALAQGGRTLTPVQHDYRVRGPRDEVLWIRTSAAPYRSSDGSVVWSAYWTDVTAQKALERELREAKEAADAASRAKSTFLATMSHEIRTPMNGVLGMLELLSLTELNAEQRAALEVVRESGRSLQRIIDDILDFSRIEAGRMELRPEPACVADIVERVRNVYAGNASGKGLLLKHAVDPAIGPALVVDPLRLQQVLNNLASNAIKFTSEGEVEIRAELAERGEGHETVRFVVADTGIGINAEDRARLFQPFAQAGEPSQYHGGTGLGLSICQQLTQLMGGTIAMRSDPGRGTEVSVTLPLPVAAASPGARAARPAGPVRRRRAAPSVEAAAAEGTLVLVVDDHAINRMVLVKQVNALGYAAEAAANGIEAIDHWSTGRFAAVLTDCNMPEMNGYELVRHIRACEARNGHERTPVIACTANVLGGEPDKCRAAGMDDYLAKPVDLAQLAERLERWAPLPAAAGEADAGATRPQLAWVREAEPVDPAVLGRIADGDARAEREILARFREFNAEDVIHLTIAAVSWDLRALQQAAHRVKGAARTIGAMGLAAACERLERAGRDRDLAAARTAMPAVMDEVERLDAWLAALERNAPARDAAPRVRGARS